MTFAIPRAANGRLAPTTAGAQQDSAQIDLAGAIDVSGTFAGNDQPAHILTDKLHVDTQTEIIRTRSASPSPGPASCVHARGLVVNIKDHTVKLEAGVHGQFASLNASRAWHWSAGVARCSAGRPAAAVITGTIDTGPGQEPVKYECDQADLDYTTHLMHLQRQCENLRRAISASRRMRRTPGPTARTSRTRIGCSPATCMCAPKARATCVPTVPPWKSPTARSPAPSSADRRRSSSRPAPRRTGS